MMKKGEKNENDNETAKDTVVAEINRVYQVRNKLWSRNWCQPDGGRRASLRRYVNLK